ncbi:hypothetical protein [Gordonia prachuapensis]|uniref:hypothetical protein n=1 Tax=Gordonia prachuapensis TaxID=3115651 RepID=UPI002ED16114
MSHARKANPVIAPVEIKVNLDSPVTDALDALGCAAEPPIRRDIWFAEARTHDAGNRFPLLAGHLTIRLRSGDRDDVTVALRPCDTERLVGRWRSAFEQPEFSYRLEQDWCGSRRVVASSAISRRPSGSVAAALSAGDDPAHVLDSAQRQFVVMCTPGGVPIDHLVTLGPVSSETWPQVRIDGCPAHVERWTVGDVDVLELAVRVIPRHGETRADLERRAATAQSVFEAAMGRRGLSVGSDHGATKTHRVMAALTVGP